MKEKQKQKGYKMKIDKEEIRHEMNDCIVVGDFEQLDRLEQVLKIFGLAPWYNEHGMVEEVTRIK